jgi:hypothetical protein
MHESLMTTIEAKRGQLQAGTTQPRRFVIINQGRSKTLSKIHWLALIIPKIEPLPRTKKASRAILMSVGLIVLLIPIYHFVLQAY